MAGQVQIVVAAPDIKVGDIVWQTDGMEAAVVQEIHPFNNFQDQPMYRVIIGNSKGVAVTMELHPENNLTYTYKTEKVSA